MSSGKIVNGVVKNIGMGGLNNKNIEAEENKKTNGTINGSNGSNGSTDWDVVDGTR